MTDPATVKGEALTTDELDRVMGGTTIVSGRQFQFEKVYQYQPSKIDLWTLALIP